MPDERAYSVLQAPRGSARAQYQLQVTRVSGEGLAASLQVPETQHQEKQCLFPKLHHPQNLGEAVSIAGAQMGAPAQP